MYFENTNSSGSPKKLIGKIFKFLGFFTDDSESTEKAILVLLFRSIINKFSAKYPAA